MTGSSRQIPPALAKAIRNEDFPAVITVADELADSDPDNACEALWRAAQDVPAMRRILAYFLVRKLTGPIADASRLWLLATPTTDAMTFVNVLSGLSVLVVEQDGIPDFHFPTLSTFLHSALEQHDYAVRISVLDFLRDYCDVKGPPRLIGRGAARQLAHELETGLNAMVEEEEVDELAEVIANLRSETVPERPPVAMSAIDSLVSKLERQSVNDQLLTFVRLQRLRESARWQARHLNRPVITVRVFEPDTRILEHLWHVMDLCRMEQRKTDGDWIDAPAASLAKHLKASEETTRATLERFRRAVAVAADDGDPSALYEFPPRQAQALAAMLMESAQKGAHAAFIFTEADPSKPQLTFEFQPTENKPKEWTRVIEEVQERGEREPEVYSEEVPQANTVAQVFQAVDAVLKKGSVEVEDIENISNLRQVNYYKQGARILAFLDSDNKPTPLARDIRSKGHEARMKVAAIAFNNSMVGRAWRVWAKKDHLADVEVETAVQFLEARAIGISGSTVPRRAQTLRKWQTELMPFYRT
jgi:hypothetical protein